MQTVFRLLSLINNTDTSNQAKKITPVRKVTKLPNFYLL